MEKVECGEAYREDHQDHQNLELQEEAKSREMHNCRPRWCLWKEEQNLEVGSRL